MGDAKKKQQTKRNRQADILNNEPNCIYCGARASTIDHFPPRVMFKNRIGPEGFEFSCCAACNNASRKNEQVVALLARIRLGGYKDNTEQQEFKKLVRGVQNNSAEIYGEWSSLSRIEQRKSFQQKLGLDGDLMRRDGGGAIKIGPLSNESINQFNIKLAKALYYRHLTKILDGFISINQIDGINVMMNGKFPAEILAITPHVERPMRESADLQGQFMYRFDFNATLGILATMVVYSSQLIFIIFALDKQCYKKLSWVNDTEESEFRRGEFDCRLRV